MRKVGGGGRRGVVQNGRIPFPSRRRGGDDAMAHRATSTTTIRAIGSTSTTPIVPKEMPSYINTILAKLSMVDSSFDSTEVQKIIQKLNEIKEQQTKFETRLEEASSVEGTTCSGRNHRGFTTRVSSFVSLFVHMRMSIHNIGMNINFPCADNEFGHLTGFF